MLLNPADIRRRAACFYQNLYRSELNLESKEENVFFDALPQMSEEDNAALSSPLSLGELHKALQCMEFKVQGFFICHIINYTGYNQK